MEHADRLVVLNEFAWRVVPEEQRHKLHLVLEGAEPLPGPRRPSRRHMDVCVVGHLREEKDPLRAAHAVRALPPESRLRVRHYGGVHHDHWARAAANEMARNPRYFWHGPVPHWQVRRALRSCHALVMTSRMEGGPNAISEAIVAGVPVISSDIDGAVGVLGSSYEGLFTVGDTEELRGLLLRAEQDNAFLRGLEAQIERRAPLFTMEAEVERWAELLADAWTWRG